MSETKLAKPTLQTSSSGVLFVNADEILLSRAGQEEIRKAAEAAIAENLRKPEVAEVSRR